MDPLAIIGAFLVGGAAGYVLGAIKTAELSQAKMLEMSGEIGKLEGMLIRRQMDDEQADEVDGNIEQVSERDQVHILEQWIRK